LKVWLYRLFPMIAIMALASTAAAAQQTPAPAPAPAAAQGQQAPQAIKMGMIDVQVVTRNAKAFKSVRDQMDKLGAKVQGDLKKEQDDLKNTQQELERQKNLLAPDAFAKKRDEWGERYQNFQRKVDVVNAEMTRVERDAVRQAEEALFKVTEDFARANAFTLIYRREMIFISVPELDVTPIIVERLDKTLPSVKVATPNFDKPGGPAAQKPAAAGAKPATAAPAQKPPAK
jgi:outer membrane protein